MTAVSEAPKFYIYASETKIRDIYAVAPFCLEHTVNFLKRKIDPSRIVLLKNAEDLNTTLSAAKGGCLVIPGGYFMWLLQDLIESTAIIKAFVQRGGCFAGFCSGGLFGSSECLQGRASISESGGHLLGLLPVRTICLSTEKTTLSSENARIRTMLDERNVRFKAFEDEGHTYEILKLVPGLKAEAAFANLKDQPIGAVSGTCGKGRVFLTGFHTEFDPPEGIKPEEGEKNDDKKANDDSKNNTEKPTIDPERTKRENFLGRIIKLLDPDLITE